MKSKNDFFVYVGITVLILIVICGSKVFFSHMEAKTFNKHTGADVSTWDALWVNLRLDCENVKKDGVD